jgi:hypothetical protein
MWKMLLDPDYKPEIALRDKEKELMMDIIVIAAINKMLRKPDYNQQNAISDKLIDHAYSEIEKMLRDPGYKSDIEVSDEEIRTLSRTLKHRSRYPAK